MKKLILILSAFLLIAIGTQAQDDTYTFRSKTGTYLSMAPAETITTGDSIYLADIEVDRNYSYVIDAYAVVDSISKEAGDTVFCVLQGKMFSGESWTDIETENLLLPAATNEVTWSSITAIYRYKFLRFYLHSKDADSNWKVETIELKLSPATLTDEAN